MTKPARITVRAHGVHIIRLSVLLFLFSSAMTASL